MNEKQQGLQSIFTGEALRKQVGQRDATESDPESVPSTKENPYGKLDKETLEKAIESLLMKQEPTGMIINNQIWVSYENWQREQEFLSSRVLDKKEFTEENLKKQFTPTVKKRNKMLHLMPKKKKRK